jgi:lysophospholipase L1-like esterase
MIGALAALLLGAAAPAGPLPVDFGGRALHEADASYRFGWPAVYFEARFWGTGIAVDVASDTDFYRLLVDGRERMRLERPAGGRLTISGLAPGEHVVRLEKLTESQTGGGRFRGFFLAGSGRLLSPPQRKGQVEFIGDSYTVGYGNTSATRTCTAAEVHDRTDSQRAFGPLVAKRLGLDYRVVASSGFGVVRNYNGNRPGETMPLLYPRLVPDDAVHVEGAAGRWRPRTIVINLGTNDFSTPLHAGEAWANAAALHTAYRHTYVAFAKRLMAEQPRARIVLMKSESFAGDVDAVAKELASPRVRTLAFGGLKLGGCNWHPSLEDHEALAALLEPLLK